MASFGTKKISYTEVSRTNDQNDGRFSWDVRYDLKFTGGVVEVDLRVKLVGANPGAALIQIWKNGIDTIWNNKAFFDDGVNLYPVKLDFSFVSSGQQQTVTYRSGVGPFNMTNWYQQLQGYGPAISDEAAAHEVGHMLGNFDEYAGGATYNNFTTTGTLMSDLTVGGLQYYFWAIEYFTEVNGYGGNQNALATVLAKLGNNASNNLGGGAGRDGFYGFGGADTINGAGGNDYIDGGLGNDVLKGGTGADKLFGGPGRDSLDGGAGNDKYVFDHLAASSRDTVRSFAAGDLILLENAVMTALTAGVLAGQFFRKGAKALDANDHVIYTPGTGALVYDADGFDPAGDSNIRTTQLAILPKNMSFFGNDDIFVV